VAQIVAKRNLRSARSADAASAARPESGRHARDRTTGDRVSVACRDERSSASVRYRTGAGDENHDRLLYVRQQQFS
jgi:hypothetical protein